MNRIFNRHNVLTAINGGLMAALLFFGTVGTVDLVANAAPKFCDNHEDPLSSASDHKPGGIFKPGCTNANTGNGGEWHYETTSDGQIHRVDQGRAEHVAGGGSLTDGE